MELNEVCSRCEKSVKVPADPDLMKLKIEEEEAVNNVIAQVKEFVRDLKDPLPEVITLTRTRNANGEYVFDVRALTRLCGPDDSKKRNKGGCMNRVLSLVADIYREAKPKE